MYVLYSIGPKCNNCTQFYETAWYWDRGRRAFLRSKTPRFGLKNPSCNITRFLYKCFKFLLIYDLILEIDECSIRKLTRTEPITSFLFGNTVIFVKWKTWISNEKFDRVGLSTSVFHRIDSVKFARNFSKFHLKIIVHKRRFLFISTVWHLAYSIDEHDTNCTVFGRPAYTMYCQLREIYVTISFRRTQIGRYDFCNMSELFTCLS